jgi:hypothetical protein
METPKKRTVKYYPCPFCGKVFESLPVKESHYYQGEATIPGYTKAKRRCFSAAQLRARNIVEIDGVFTYQR